MLNLSFSALPFPPFTWRLATGVDFRSKTLRCREVFKGTEHDVDYDYLVIATGAQNNTFGVPGVNEVIDPERGTFVWGKTAGKEGMAYLGSFRKTGYSA